MGFLLVNYQTNAGTIVRIRTSDATIAVAGNTAVTGTPDDANIFAYAQNPGSKRKKQLNARGLKLQRFTGTGDARKRYTTFVPFFSQTALDAITIGTAITLRTVAWTVFDKVSEA